MAKETKEQKPAKAQETTVDNVVEQLRAKNLQSSTSVQAALEKMQKETEEKKRDEAIRAIKKFEYKNFRALLELRKRRAEGTYRPEPHFPQRRRAVFPVL